MSDQWFYILVALAVIVLLRNQWVYRMRIWMINADIDQFMTMPSYMEMFVRMGTWSARGFGWRVK